MLLKLLRNSWFRQGFLLSAWNRPANYQLIQDFLIFFSSYFHVEGLFLMYYGSRFSVHYYTFFLQLNEYKNITFLRKRKVMELGVHSPW